MADQMQRRVKVQENGLIGQRKVQRLIGAEIPAHPGIIDQYIDGPIRQSSGKGRAASGGGKISLNGLKTFRARRCQSVCATAAYNHACAFCHQLAISKPMPSVPPVTNAVLFVIFMLWFQSFLLRTSAS
jgi:hypothetical protein